MSENTDVSVRVEDSIAIITIERPEVRNALRYATLRGLQDAMNQITWDDEIRAGVITGAGGLAFSAGADLKDIKRANPDQAAAERYMMSGQLTCSAIWGSPKPIVAAIDGYALGGGLEIALACHQRVATAHSQLGLPEIRLQHLPAWGGIARLAALTRMHTVLLLALSGEFIDGEQAHKEGLIDELAEPVDIVDKAMNLAKRLSIGKPAIVARGLEIFRHVYELEKPAVLAMERWAAGMDFATDDHRNQIDKFTQGRSA